jgi:hypothetical protein
MNAVRAILLDRKNPTHGAVGANYIDYVKRFF